MLFRRCCIWLFYLFSLSLVSQQALSLTPVQLSSIEQPYPITHQLEYLKDPEGQLTLEKILKTRSLQWQQHQDENPNFGITGDTYWWRFKVRNNLTYNDWMLAIHTPLLDWVDLYIQLDAEEQITHHRFGDHFVFKERSISHQQFLTSLDIPKDKTATIYVRIQSESTIQGPIKIWPSKLFFTEDQAYIIRQGFYYGGMVIMALFNLIIFIMVKEKNYFYYATFVLFLTLFQAGIHGFGYQYLWPNFPWFQQISSILALNISMGFAGLFFHNLLLLNKRNWLASQWIRFISVFLIAQAFIILFAPYIWSLRISIISVSILAISSMFISIPLYFKNIVEAKFFIFGWAVMVIGGVLMALDRYGILPPNFITVNAFQIGSIIQVLLLSAAIANRLNTEKRQLLLAEQHALKVERDAKENLEKKVLERTQELEVLNAKLNALSKTDALTGILNRRAFDEIYQTETEYCKKHDIPLAILILDIDHFKDINDTYGHESGDECLRMVGKVLKEQLTDANNHVTRYGGEEFVIAMRNTSKQEAMNYAEVLRQAIENTSFQADGKSISATASIGVASGIPKLTSEAGLLFNADRALYKAKHNGRNQVQLSYS